MITAIELTIKSKIAEQAGRTFLLIRSIHHKPDVIHGIVTKSISESSNVDLYQIHCFYSGYKQLKGLNRIKSIVSHVYFICIISMAAFKQKHLAWFLIINILIAALLLSILIGMTSYDQIVASLKSIDSYGWLAPVVFVMLMVLVVVFLVPGVLFTTGAGFIFGPLLGSIYVIIGTLVGSCLSFMIARYLFGESIAQKMREHRRLRGVTEILITNDWKVVLITRLIPFFPFKLSNYLFGISPVSLKGFLLGTALGIIPFSVHNVYLGSIAFEVAGLTADHQQQIDLQWWLYAGGFALTILVVLASSNWAVRMLRRCRSGPTG